MPQCVFACLSVCVCVRCVRVRAREGVHDGLRNRLGSTLAALCSSGLSTKS